MVRRLLNLFLILVILIPQVSLSQSSEGIDQFDLSMVPTYHTYKALCGQENKSEILPMSQMSNICKIVMKSEYCENVDSKDLLECSSLNVASSAPFKMWDFVAGCAKGVFDSIKSLLSFIWDILAWVWESSTSSEKRAENSAVADEYIGSVKLYLHSEYHRAYSKTLPPLRKLKAAKMLSDAIGMMILKTISDLIVSEYRQFGCLNFKAKSALTCKMIGDIFLPPAAAIGLLKHGKKAFKMFPQMEKAFGGLKKMSKMKPKKPLVSEAAKPLLLEAAPEPLLLKAAKPKNRADSDFIFKQEEMTVEPYKKVGPINKDLKGASGKKYETTELDERYFGENFTPAASFNTKVRYFDKAEQDSFKVFVNKQGQIVDYNGHAIETGEIAYKQNAIYVMDHSGNIYLYPDHIRGKFHHSTLNGGRPVAAAGEVELIDGYIGILNERSGHYKPGKKHLKQIVEELESRGADFSEAYINLH